jgi:glycosyltransferase involved in cell wall biosynthesis
MLKSEKKMNLRFILVLQILDKNYFNEIKKFIKENFEKNEIIFFHNLNNNYLANLYKKAKFYIFSSYCEVFGLTSLEAMSQGCPIIISDKSALPEINGEAAEYFNPDNIDQTKKSMEKLIYDTNHRDNLILKGNIQFKKYSWKKTVNETLDILGI